MTQTEILDTLREWACLDDYTHEQKRAIEGLYFRALGQRFKRTSCSNCYRDACILIYNQLKRNGMATERKYRLKAGALLQRGFGDTRFYTDKSLTDDVAREILAQSPELIRLFSEFPKGWKKDVTKAKEQEETKEATPAEEAPEAPKKKKKTKKA